MHIRQAQNQYRQILETVKVFFPIPKANAYVSKTEKRSNEQFSYKRNQIDQGTEDKIQRIQKQEKGN